MSWNSLERASGGIADTPVLHPTEGPTAQPSRESSPFTNDKHCQFQPFPTVTQPVVGYFPSEGGGHHGDYVYAQRKAHHSEC
jgi:hypothetical protein